MRGVFIYILMAIQVTLSGQSVQFNFKNYQISNIGSFKTVSFQNSYFDEYFHAYHQLNLKMKLSNDFSIISIDSEPCSNEEKIILENWTWKSSPTVKIQTGISNNNFYSTVKVYPYFLRNGAKHKIKEIELNVQNSKIETITNFKSRDEITESVLNSGTWFKFKIHESGMYRISYEEFVELNIIQEPISTNQISVFSNPSRMLDFTVGNKRPQDLIEITSKINGVSSSIFGPGSSLIFYAEANGHEHYDESNEIFKNEINLYSDTNFIYINTSALSRNKISNTALSNPSDTVFDYIKINHHEKELINFIKSGREWLGENFDKNPLTWNNFYTPPVQKPPRLKIKYKVCARSNISADNKISLILNNDTVSFSEMKKINTGPYADYVVFSTNTYETNNYKNLQKDSLRINFFYHQTENTKAWIDYFTINTTERITTEKEEMIVHFSDQNNKVNAINVSSTFKNPVVWDITNTSRIKEVKTNMTDSGFTFNSELDTIKTFIFFEEKNIHSPEFVSKVVNQNLHGLSSTNYLILTKKQFSSQANRLIDLHTRHDNLSGQVVFINDIYNEFSCGRPEATAIRDFIKLLYERGKETEDSLCYVLLLGKGSYDPKNRISNNINYIPTFQSINSVKLTSSYVTDDFYGLMDEHEGTYSNGDLLDLGIGRIPVKNNQEAKNVVDKIYEYYDEYSEKDKATNYEKKLLTSKGSWKNNIVFIGDDGDFNEHMNNSNSLAQKADTTISTLNQKKIFVDAFPQESSSAGDLSPETNKKLNKTLHEGALIVNYTGHGGELGWASERIFLVNDIQSMTNRHRLPLFMTATCEFSRFDCPNQVSAGEHLILQPQGGAIALFTTVRLVFSRPNLYLNEAFYSVLESSIKNNKTVIGDIFKNTKVTNNGGKNDRNFTLLGDPALRLAVPSNKIVLDSITYENLKTDTIKSISSPTLHGRILMSDNATSLNFNGWIEITLFDKEQTIETLANDENANPFSYRSKENLLFIGKGNVINGHFSSSIFVPKDVRQNFDFSRLSFYAVDSSLGDATGYDESIIIGGTEENIIQDNTGPDITLFLDDTTFVFGDNVTPSPIFIASLTDSSGINIIPDDVGKDLVLTIDGRSDLNFILNNYYTPSTTNYKNGVVIFPIEQLREGRHSFEFKAFDNQNNSSKAYTEFIIENNPKLALKHLLNYPNPFTQNTGFYFEHNQTSEDLEILINIYTISGKIIKTLEGVYSASSQRIGPIHWDGLDEFGDKIGKGVYVYQITAKNSKGDTDKAIQKLVLLR
ncbi:MAG: hypothetical protein CMP63_07760 [Flavobacteriales bacterium]|nr:hypothetical protein [Flavobacteriales bacterium]